jgi:hypothetical protein
MHEKLATEQDISDNQCCTSLSDSLLRQNSDLEVTEVLQQEWSWDYAEGALSQPYILPT